MGYINQTDPNTAYGLMPGDAQPISYMGWDSSSTNQFHQSMEVPGVQTDTPYYYGGNNYSVAVASGPSTGGFQFPSAGGGQIATTFNVNINEGDVPGGTAYSVVDLAVGAGPLLEVTASSSGAPTTYTLGYDATTLNDLIDLRIEEEGATTSNSWDQISGDTGVADTGTAEANLSMSSAGYGGANQYLKITGSGSDNAANMEFSFTRPLYEQFTGDEGGTAVATTQNDVFNFKGGDWITTTMGTDKVTIDLTTPPLCYSTIETDDGTLTALAPNLPLKITNTTTIPVAKSCLTITGNDVGASGTDEVRFAITPQSHAGFGAQLVRIVSYQSSGSSSLGGYHKYSVTAYFFNGESSSPSSSSSSQTLYDYSKFMGDHFIANPDLLISGTIEPPVFTYVTHPIGSVLLAQRVSSNSYVMGTIPVLNAECALV